MPQLFKGEVMPDAQNNHTAPSSPVGKPPSIASIGAGYWGKNLVRNFASLGALSSVCESNHRLWGDLAAAYPEIRVTDSVEEVLSDSGIDAVAIATPAETHADLVRRALLAGKDVFVEKPLCLHAEEGRRLAALARTSNRILMVGHLLWYHPAVLRLKQLIDDGELGRIQYIYSNRLNLGKIRREENILWSFAPHDISVILGLLSEMPHSVRAQGGNYLHENIADVTVSVLSFPSGVKAHIFVSWLHPFKEQKLVVVGDRKMAVFDDMAEHKLVVYPHAITWKNQAPIASRAEAEPVTLDEAEPLRQECAHFLECIRTRRAPRTDAEEGVRVLAVLEQCQQALQAGDAAPDPSTTVKNVTVPAADGPKTRDYFAHESAFIDKNVDIGKGTTIWHVSHILADSTLGKNCRIGQNVVIGPKVTIGDGVKIQNNVSVYEGVTLEDGVFCGPSMVFTNVMNPRSEIPRMSELRSTLVRRGASLGANSTIVCGTTIGQYAFVGAGTVVLKDIPDYALVVGNPGRVVGWMCKCGSRITFEQGEGLGSCKTCDQKYWKTGMIVSPQ
jgi:UDP-2-acetamido-3-amino-2,3-dideoxy-glucuronate N-acetyltransferase